MSKRKVHLRTLKADGKWLLSSPLCTAQAKPPRRWMALTLIPGDVTCERCLAAMGKGGE